MNIEKGKIIELENNNEYYIIDKIILRKKCYLYISKLEPENKEDLNFVEYKDNKVYPVTNNEIIKDLLLMVNKNKL